MKDKHIIGNTIRLFVYQDYARARLVDYLSKQGCNVKGAGIYEDKFYLLYDADELLFFKDIFYEKQKEQLREY